MKTKDGYRMLHEVWPVTKRAAFLVGRSVGYACRTVLECACKERPLPPPTPDEFPIPSPPEEDTDFFQGCERVSLPPDRNVMEAPWMDGEPKPILPAGGKEVDVAGKSLRTAVVTQSFPTIQLVEKQSAVQPTRPERNLDNKPWFGMMEEVVRLEGEIERLSPKLPMEARNFAEHIFARLEEILDRNGAVSIDESACVMFEGRLHQPFPSRVVKDGEPIVRVLSPGWRVKERVLRRAKVVVPEAVTLANQ